MMKKSELRELTVKELRTIVKENELEIVGAWKMKKDELVEEIYVMIYEAWGIVDDESPEEIKVEGVEEVEEVQEEKPSLNKRGGKKKSINVYKDGELIETIDGLINTLKWSVENGIANQGWVKNSLKTGKETVAGRKFKEGGYKFEYAE